MSERTIQAIVVPRGDAGNMGPCVLLEPAAGKLDEREMEVLVGAVYVRAYAFNKDIMAWQDRRGFRVDRPKVLIATEDVWARALLMQLANQADLITVPL